jgi:1,2-dihydroxy-3-keto-5-methylthiopentene dioxygenase
MRSYYFDNQPGDQRLLHDSGNPVSIDKLEAIGARYWRIPIDDEGKWESAVNEVAHERGYKNRDTINVTKEGLGDAYEPKLKMFYEECVILPR